MQHSCNKLLCFTTLMFDNFSVGCSYSNIILSYIIICLSFLIKLFCLVTQQINLFFYYHKICLYYK